MRKVITMPELTLKQIIDKEYTIHRFPPDSPLPAITGFNDFLNITRTDDELSIVCGSGYDITAEKSDTRWSMLKILGPLDFSLTGILADIATCLKHAKISIFAISTYDTDYILVKSSNIADAVSALKNSGYKIV